MGGRILKPPFKQLAADAPVARGMTIRLALIAALVSLVAAAPASAAYRVGLGEQKPEMFQNSSWQSLKLKRVRYLVPWDYAKVRWQRDAVNHYMSQARIAKQDVLVTFTAKSGCYSATGRYSKKKACRAPSTTAYRKAFLAFDKAYPWVKTYSAWNEINHKSQPTFKSPKKAAGYYNVNRRRTTYTKQMLRSVPGEVWLTETGGIVKLLPSFKRSTSRAKSRTTGMF